MHFMKEFPTHCPRMLKTVGVRHHGLLLIFSFIVSSVNAQSINLVKDTVLPVKGSSFGMSCILSVSFTGSSGIAFLRNDNPLLVSCQPRGCSILEGYTFKVNQSGVFMTISSLDRDSHQGTWKCRYAGSIDSNTVNLDVYTLPTGIGFIEEPSENVDLSFMSARFQCKTIGCSYPDPVIRWMYENQIMSTGTQTLASDGCTLSEKIYTSTLFFQRNSTLSDNSDKTVFFSCIADYPGASKNFRADATKSVRFAVRVTEVVLQQNNKNITDIMTVNLGEPIIFTCITGLSRPDPSIDWYIGSQKRGNGPSLKFTPSNEDHNQIIYCQAYNTDPNRIVYSLMPRLSVQVRVTEAALHQNGQAISNATLIVTSGKPTTLSCVTGNSRPDAKIDWYIGSEKRGNGTSLNFIPTNEDHAKAIYCQAYNIDPNQPVFSNKPILFVRAAPRILDVSPDYKGYVGQCAIIKLDFYSNTDENLTITARHFNSSGLIHQGIIKPTHLDDLPISVFRAFLFISLLNDNDFGLYTIEVKNAVGSDSKSIKIIEQITPEKPFNFHATNVQEKQLSLTWQSGYNGGYTQTFIVEISLDNITWNNVSQVSAGNRDGWFTTVIEDLMPGSEYYLRLYACNINGRGDFADVHLAIITLKDFSASVGIGVGGAVGVGVGGIVLGLIGAIIAFTIRRQLNGSKCSCFRSKRRTDDELHSYSNTEMNPQTVKPIYEELNKGNTEQSVYDKISPL